MLRTLLACAVAAFAALAAMPVHASAVPAPAPAAAIASPFAEAPLSDDALSLVRGTARPVETGAVRRMASDDFEALNRLTAQTMPVTFDNWLFDIGLPLIVANVRGQ